MIGTACRKDFSLQISSNQLAGNVNQKSLQIRRTAKSLHKIQRTIKIRQTPRVYSELTKSAGFFHKIRRTNVVPWYILWYIPWYKPSCQRAFRYVVVSFSYKSLNVRTWSVLTKPMRIRLKSSARVV
jgi:hypothetical protein